MAIFLYPNLNVQLFCICAALNHLCASIIIWVITYAPLELKPPDVCHCLLLVLFYDAVYTAAVIPPWPSALSASHQEG